MQPLLGLLLHHECLNYSAVYDLNQYVLCMCGELVIPNEEGTSFQWAAVSS